MDRPAPEWEYIFKHIITQEVAYESLLFAHRRALHQQVAEYLERTYADNLEEYYELLAHHSYQSGDQGRSWKYLIKAGDKARDKYANEAAIAHYSQALSLDIDKTDQEYEMKEAGARRVHESLGDVYRLIGQYEKALSSYQQSLECHPFTAAQAAGTRRKIAKTWELQGQYDEAMHYLDLAKTALAEELAPLEMAYITNDMGWIARRRGDYEESLRLCAQGLDVAESLPRAEENRRVRAELQHTLGTTYLRTGDYVQAIAHFQACIKMRESIGDLYGAGRSYNNLAAVYWSQSDYDSASQYIRKSLEMHQKIGNTYGTAMCYSNLGLSTIPWVIILAS